MTQVLDVFFQHESFQALERVPDLLMKSEPLECLEVFINSLMHHFVDFFFQDDPGFQQNFPIANHQNSQMLPREGRLIEVQLKRWAREPTEKLLPQVVLIGFHPDWQ